MNQEIMKKLEKVKEHYEKVEELTKLLVLADWDLRIIMPKKALDSRANTISFISGELFKLATSNEVASFIAYFEPLMDELSVRDRAMIRKMKREYDQISKIPEDRYKEFSRLSILSERAWEEAKEKSDFSIFKPHLEKIVDMKREFAEYYGYEDNKYDALLNEYEEGLTVKKLDLVFGELKEAIINLLDYINSSNNKVDYSFLQDKYDIEKQKELSDYLLDLIQFDKEKGRLDETEHPFTTNMGNKDVRITTHYYERDLFSNIFSVIHEGGHALYEMHISDDLIGTGLAEVPSMSLHESQSRFYENIVGRSKEFLSVILPTLKEKFPQLEDIDVDKLYKAVNKVEPSLIRTEADELTYSLHIIIRYEIEKQLINGEISVSELPEVWNKKYKEYLGVEPKNDAEGVLQDMHWSDGSFGYFPSYALGNLYGCQMLNTMLKENSTALTDLKNGDLTYINNWLSDNVHKYGSLYDSEELLERVTGEKLNPKYFIDYLNKKYKDIY